MSRPSCARPLSSPPAISTPSARLIFAQKLFSSPISIVNTNHHHAAKYYCLTRPPRCHRIRQYTLCTWNGLPGSMLEREAEMREWNGTFEFLFSTFPLSAHLNIFAPSAFTTDMTKLKDSNTPDRSLFNPPMAPAGPAVFQTKSFASKYALRGLPPAMTAWYASLRSLCHRSEHPLTCISGPH
jgi:hypothetical protein